ncbi:shikimate kinase [Granulicella sp. dw_53]|uniref:shikimate kinase n=1 Tax=Granulicella sp. dw_53 TaxID=2719792 RepID=UPI001BD3B7CF|nr:shikimate kinase [Granulicella sp. dw_53]
MAHLFLIGPGGVGKSAAGRFVASMLGRDFIDLDEEFCARVEPIRSYLDRYGYAAYVRRNATLFGELLEMQEEPALFVLSSGFLVTDVEPEVVASNRLRVKEAGTSILLMPSRSFEESMKIVLERQMGRGLGLNYLLQQATFAARFDGYMELGDLQVFSSEGPSEVAKRIVDRLSARVSEG